MSNNLNLDQVAEGQSNAEVTINDQAGQLDAAITEKLSVVVTNTNVATVTSTQLRRNNMLSIDPGSPVPSGAITITIPGSLERGLFVVLNTTAQAVTVTITGQPVTAPTVSAGLAVTMHSDGINVRSVGGGSTTFDASAITTGTLPEARGGTGATSFTASQLVRQNAGATALESTGKVLTDFVLVTDATRYDVSQFFAGAPGASALLFRFVALRSLVMPASLTGSRFYGGVAATASATFDIQVNGVSKGSLVWAAAGQNATITFTTQVILAAGDFLTVVAPGSADATLADISLGFKLTATS